MYLCVCAWEARLYAKCVLMQVEQRGMCVFVFLSLLFVCDMYVCTNVCMRVCMVLYTKCVLMQVEERGMCVFVFLPLFVSVRLCVYDICVCVCMHACLYVCTCIYVSIHTYAHT